MPLSKSGTDAGEVELEDDDGAICNAVRHWGPDGLLLPKSVFRVSLDRRLSDRIGRNASTPVTRRQASVLSALPLVSG